MKKTSLVLLLVVLVACSRETPAEKDVAPSLRRRDEPSAESRRHVTYDDAVTWLRSTKGFHFIVEEGGVRGEGDMERATVGAERVQVTVNGETWEAAASPKGVVWRRDEKEVAAPGWGNRLYQRVTVAFDPQKAEGQAQLIEPGHFRFTDANTGAQHDVWVNAAGQVERMTIGNTFSMTLSEQQ